MYRRNPDIEIPDSELVMTAARAGGPGGQHVNKTSSKINLSWNLTRSSILTDEEKDTVARKLPPRMLKVEDTADGPEVIVHLSSSSTRSQHKNREAAKLRLVLAVNNALRPEKPRKPTKVPKKAKERRIQDKKRRGQKKQGRQGGFEDNPFDCRGADMYRYRRNDGPSTWDKAKRGALGAAKVAFRLSRKMMPMPDLDPWAIRSFGSYALDYVIPREVRTQFLQGLDSHLKLGKQQCLENFGEEQCQKIENSAISLGKKWGDINRKIQVEIGNEEQFDAWLDVFNDELERAAQEKGTSMYRYNPSEYTDEELIFTALRNMAGEEEYNDKALYRDIIDTIHNKAFPDVALRTKIIAVDRLFIRARSGDERKQAHLPQIRRIQAALREEIVHPPCPNCGGSRRNPWEDDSVSEPLNKRLRRLCRSDLGIDEISDFLDVPSSWVASACQAERQGPGWRGNPDKIVYPYRTSVKLGCDTCGIDIYPGETCEATCMEMGSGSLLSPHEIKCEHCLLVGRRFR